MKWDEIKALHFTGGKKGDETEAHSSHSAPSHSECYSSDRPTCGSDVKCNIIAMKATPEVVSSDLCLWQVSLKPLQRVST